MPFLRRSEPLPRRLSMSVANIVGAWACRRDRRLSFDGRVRLLPDRRGTSGKRVCVSFYRQFGSHRFDVDSDGALSLRLRPCVPSNFGSFRRRDIS